MKWSKLRKAKEKNIESIRGITKYLFTCFRLNARIIIEMLSINAHVIDSLIWLVSAMPKLVKFESRVYVAYAVKVK